MREPAKGKVTSTSKEKAGTPPPPDVKKVLSEHYETDLSKKFRGKKTNFDQDGDEAEEDAIDVNADKATPNKTRRATLEDKKAKLEKLLEETEGLLSGKGLKDVLKSKDSEEDKLNQAFLLGQQAADLKRSTTPPQSRDSRDLLQIPKSEDVPLGIPPEEWESLEVQSKLYIRKIAQDPERSQYFDWGNALFSARTTEVQKNLDCLANEPTHKLSGLCNKPEKTELKKSAKEADSSAALSISIVKQAQQAGQPPKRGSAAERMRFLNDYEIDEDHLVGFHKITTSDLVNEEKICSKLVIYAHDPNFNPMQHKSIIPASKLLPGKEPKSLSWWRSLIAAYSAVSEGTKLDEHNIRVRAVALPRNKKAIGLGTEPRHSAYPSDSDSDHSRKSKSKSGSGDDSDWYENNPKLSD